jgi:hypothetical protein
MLIATTLFSFAMLSASAQLVAPSITTCNVTSASDGGVGNRQLSTMGLWPNGTVIFRPGGPGFITADGALGMKFAWQRGIVGRLTITGRRLDGDAPPLRSEVPAGYGPSGFQATYIIFPTPGCWEVTGTVGDASLTFVTSVVKIGDGPSWHRDVR